jgi:hypothetical protein
MGFIGFGFFLYLDDGIMFFLNFLFGDMFIGIDFFVEFDEVIRSYEGDFLY